MLGRFSKYLAKAEDWLATAGAVAIGAMMVITVVDVIARDVFHDPIAGSYEYISLLFVAVVILAVSFAQRRWEHLAMGVVFDQLRPGGYRRYILIFLLVIGVGFKAY